MVPHRVGEIARLSAAIAAIGGNVTAFGTWESDLDPASVPENVRALRIERVSAYALRPVWTDGHSTGIYTFTYLRQQICECAECTTGAATPS